MLNYLIAVSIDIYIYIVSPKKTSTVLILSLSNIKFYLKEDDFSSVKFNAKTIEYEIAERL